MKRIISYSVILVGFLFFVNCTTSSKMHFYKEYKNEIKNDVFRKFENNLPLSFDESLMSKIMNAPSFNYLGYSGIDILYGFNTKSFDIELQKVYDASIFSCNITHDTTKIDSTHSEYLSFVYKQQKIAIPRANEDFCRVNDTCFNWSDLDLFIFDFGSKKVFSRNVTSEYKLSKTNCKYTIGAFVSRKKQHIIYWLLIYS